MLRANNMSHRKMPRSWLLAAMSSLTSAACMQKASLSDQLKTAHAKRTVTTAGASGSTAGADGGSSVRQAKSPSPNSPLEFLLVCKDTLLSSALAWS